MCLLELFALQSASLKDHYPRSKAFCRPSGFRIYNTTEIWHYCQCQLFPESASSRGNITCRPSFVRRQRVSRIREKRDIGEFFFPNTQYGLIEISRRSPYGPRKSQKTSPNSGNSGSLAQRGEGKRWASFLSSFSQGDPIKIGGYVDDERDQFSGPHAIYYTTRSPRIFSFQKIS